MGDAKAEAYSERMLLLLLLLRLCRA